MGIPTIPEFKLYWSATVVKATIPRNQKNETSTSLRIHFTPGRMVRIKETRQVLARMLGIETLIFLLVGMQIGADQCRNQRASSPQKIRTRASTQLTPTNSERPLGVSIPYCRDTSSSMLIGALSTTGRAR